MKQLVKQPETYNDTLRLAVCASYDGNLRTENPYADFETDRKSYIVRIIREGSSTPKVTLTPDRVSNIDMVVVVVVNSDKTEVLEAYVIPMNAIGDRKLNRDGRIEISMSRAMSEYERPVLTHWLRSFK